MYTIPAHLFVDAKWPARLVTTAGDITWLLSTPFTPANPRHYIWHNQWPTHYEILREHISVVLDMRLELVIRLHLAENDDFWEVLDQEKLRTLEFLLRLIFDLDNMYAPTEVDFEILKVLYPFIPDSRYILRAFAQRGKFQQLRELAAISNPCRMDSQLALGGRSSVAEWLATMRMFPSARLYFQHLDYSEQEIIYAHDRSSRPMNGPLQEREIRRVFGLMVVVTEGLLVHGPPSAAARFMTIAAQLPSELQWHLARVHFYLTHAFLPKIYVPETRILRTQCRLLDGDVTWLFEFFMRACKKRIDPRTNQTPIARLYSPMRSRLVQTATFLPVSSATRTQCCRPSLYATLHVFVTISLCPAVSSSVSRRHVRDELKTRTSSRSGLRL